MRKVILLILTTGALPLLGCASGDVDLLEARLRSKDAELRALNNQLESSERRLSTTEREITQLQRQLAGSNPEVTSRFTHIESIEINKRLTGALNEDGKPGDDVLNVVIAPMDAMGEVVKLEGRIEVEAIDPSLPEAKRKLGEWTIPLEQSADKWHDGFLGQGYQLTAPWQRTPQSQEIVLLARYTTPDGRSFSTTQDINIIPPSDSDQSPELLPLPAAQRKPADEPMVIQPASFEQEKTAEAKPFPMTAPEITPKPISASREEPKPLPIQTGSRPISLEELLKTRNERETPPFVE